MPTVVCAGALVLAACTPAIRPLPPIPAPAPRAVQGGPEVGDSVWPQARSATRPDSLPAVLAVPESLAVATRAILADVSASLGVPDSVLFSPRARPDSAASAGSEEADDEEPTWDLDVASYATQDRVLAYVNLFSGRARDRIESRLQRGKRYEPMIREKFRAAGIPEDMYYLALVESGYDPHAYSRAAAVGMWQFMSSTARGVGLRVDWWIDERRDPVRATDAAARFLNQLYRQFGSYYLAAAAYNGGPGRVSRGLARFQDELADAAGDDRFFALAEQSYLRAETRNYVPQLIAAALIGKTPERFGMAVPEHPSPFAYDSVRVPALVSLSTIAEASQATLAEIRDLNPHFLRGATPPSYTGWVRIPAGRALVFDSSWTVMTPEQRSGVVSVRSTSGQSVATIAKEHGVDARRLGWFNPRLSAGRRLPPGTLVLVPTAGVLAAARDVPDPGIERYGPSQVTGRRVVHRVKRGETLGGIARRYGTTVANLRRLNGFRRSSVYAGQSIIVRLGTPVRRASARSATANRASAKKPTGRNARATASKGARSAPVKSQRTSSAGATARKK